MAGSLLAVAPRSNSCMFADLSHTFKIANLELSNRLVQAPLAGISCSAFRELFTSYAKPAYAVSEMISANSILEHATALRKRYLHRADNEGLWCIQLSGSDPKTLAKAVKICQTYSPDLIDLNCGCPKSKIRSKGAGSALMDNPENLKSIVSAMRDATDLPFTVKIRTSGVNYLQAAMNIAEAGADALIVHGRQYTEDYDVPANYTRIKEIATELTIPVIANGDVDSLSSAQNALEKSCASALMVGRGSIGKPWFFQNILSGTSFIPSLTERIAIFQQHIINLAVLENSESKAVMQGRRLLKWYFPEVEANKLANCYQIFCLRQLISVLTSIIQESGNVKISEHSKRIVC